MVYLYIYLVFATLVATLYVYLNFKYFPNPKMKNVRKIEFVEVYGLLWVTMFGLAPLGVYEIITTYMKGGFKNDN